MRQTLGDVVNSLPDLREHYAPPKLSEQSAHPVRDVLLEVGGWLVVISLIAVMIVGGAFATGSFSNRITPHERIAREIKQSQREWLQLRKSIEKRNIERCMAAGFDKRLCKIGS